MNCYKLKIIGRIVFFTYEMLKKINIAKKVKTYEDLSNNLVRDLKNPLKKDSKTSNYLNNLGQRTLENTMGKINNFIK